MGMMPAGQQTIGGGMQDISQSLRMLAEQAPAQKAFRRIQAYRELNPEATIEDIVGTQEKPGAMWDDWLTYTEQMKHGLFGLGKPRPAKDVPMAGAPTPEGLARLQSVIGAGVTPTQEQLAAVPVEETGTIPMFRLPTPPPAAPPVGVWGDIFDLGALAELAPGVVDIIKDTPLDVNIMPIITRAMGAGGMTPAVIGRKHGIMRAFGLGMAPKWSERMGRMEDVPIAEGSVLYKALEEGNRERIKDYLIKDAFIPEWEVTDTDIETILRIWAERPREGTRFDPDKAPAR